jgi:protein-S-isoprenylcysteine O-methyltransferase Ste14
MYVAVLWALLGEAVFFGSATLLVVAAVAFLCFHLWVLGYEEPTLRRKFGESYKRYCRAVSRWIPGRPERDAA